ncbi:MAG: transcription-repair coupling factor [Lachnospiraceae bacterium]|nr:transcription-repair coupling factor [Lachnospiraceae bacterium]
MDSFYEPLKSLPAFRRAAELLRGGKRFGLSGLKDSRQVHFMSALGQAKKYQIVVTYSEIRAKELLDEYRFYDRRALYYPAKDFIFMGADAKGNLLATDRMRVFRRILEGEAFTVILPIDALMDSLLPLSVIRNNILHFQTAEVIDPEEVIRRLVLLGYERRIQAELPGQFAARGSILDIYPVTEETPFRIDLFDDEIDIIKSFDPQSQRSIENAESFDVYPAAEYIFTRSERERGIERILEEERACEAAFRDRMKNETAHELSVMVSEYVEQVRQTGGLVDFDKFLPYFANETVNLLDYFPGDDSVIYLDEPARLRERADALEEEFRMSTVNRLEKGYMLPGQADVMTAAPQVFADLASRCVVPLSALGQASGDFPCEEMLEVNGKTASSYNSQFDAMAEDVNRYRNRGYAVILLSASRTRAERLARNLNDFDVPAFYSDSLDRVVRPREVMTAYGYVGRGFEYPEIKFLVIAETDIFPAERAKKRKKKKDFQGNVQDFSELSVGDYVIHEDHGVGIYQGIEKVEVDGVIEDYLKIAYSENGVLYVKTTGLDRIQKFAGSDTERANIKLNRLGGAEWRRTKARVRGAVKDIAEELVALYAARQKEQGFEFSPDTVWQREFEEMFPFEETEDQLKAIDAMKRDMQSTKLMDRLICGDVGFGKTEVAIRGAFKAVQDGKQVAMLVPTTILAQQHFNNFVQRFRDFPVRVEMLNRFRTPAQQKKTIEGLKSGYVDIVIGTHRLLSKDIAFKDLGLLIVDEEQRFGVTHKEKIKQMRKNIDVLTLTATPIPRTLHMSLIGIRDLSILEDPPMDRLPIQTYVCEYNDEMVREAIRRELARGGQVYYVYNRVAYLDRVASQIASLVPEAKVVYAHGRMEGHQLEKIMYDFVAGEIDVLVSTTIVETGLDIPNVNTMIIHDADKFGLAQLYQLRGRIGRAKRTAYAFLMYQKNKVLKEDAEKRLTTLREFTELGSGVKIAMRDLEIRGAGNLLGAEQSGHMEDVGYDLYCKMLNEAVMEAKGERPQPSFETTVDLHVDAYIPSGYIKNEALKLDMYKRIADMADPSEREDIMDELFDRFGDIPRPVDNLLWISALRAAAHAAGVATLTGNRREYRFYMYQEAPIVPERIPQFIQSYGGQMQLKQDREPFFYYVPKSQPKDDAARLRALIHVAEDLKRLSAPEQAEEHAEDETAE